MTPRLRRWPVSVLLVLRIVELINAGSNECMKFHAFCIYVKERGENFDNKGRWFTSLLFSLFPSPTVAGPTLSSPSAF